MKQRDDVFSQASLRTVLGYLSFTGIVLGGVFFASFYQLYVLTLAGVYALATIGYQVIFGMGGLFSLAQGTFYGLGAYVSGLIALHYGWGFEVSVFFTVVCVVFLACTIGLPVLHLESHYFALATLGFSQVVLLIALHWQDLTGGANGLAGIPEMVLFGFPVGRRTYALLVWFCVGVGVWCGLALQRSGFGLALTQVRDDVLVARCLGLRVTRLRLVAFVISAVYGGIAGALLVHGQGVLSTEVLDFSIMVTILSMAVIGGRSRMVGAVLGAVFLFHLPEWLRGFGGAYLLWYGVVLLVVICFVPQGMMGLLVQLYYVFFPRQQRPLPTALPLLQASRVRHNVQESCLTLTHAVKTFGGVRAIDDVTFSLKRGCITGLIGPNGSGKTTLINVLSGLETLDGGRLSLFGRDVTRSGAIELARCGVARTFQHMCLTSSWSVLDSVVVGRLRFCRGDRTRAEGEVVTLLERLELLPYAYSLCGTLPPALQQRVGLARALSQEPYVLLLDEPTAGLTIQDRQHLLHLLQELVLSDMTILVIEHNTAFLRQCVEYCVCLYQGSILVQGLCEDVLLDERVLEMY